jgi:hypothetical protein
VLKVSLVLNAIGALVFVLGVWVTWSLAVQRGIPEKAVDFFDNFSLVFTANGELYFRAVLFFAIVLYATVTALMTLGAVLYNLISDVVGGIELIVLEETYLVPAPRTTPVRPAVHTPGNGASVPTKTEPVAATSDADTTKTEPVAATSDADTTKTEPVPTAEGS